MRGYPTRGKNKPKYFIVDPGESKKKPDGYGRVVSRHIKLSVAKRAHAKLAYELRMKGLKCTAYIWDVDAEQLVPT